MYIGTIMHFYVVCKAHVYRCNNAHVRGAFNKFSDFFVQAFKIVVDS